MNRSIVLGIIIVLIVGIGGWWWYAAHAGAEAGKSYTIGILVRGSGYDPAVAGFKARMAELGYIEGKNIRYDTQFVSDASKLTGTVDKFLNENVDLIHTYSTPATVAAVNEVKARGKATPIIFGSVGDPLLIPGVHALERPGENVTGIASLSTDLTSKRLQLLKEYDPSIKRVAMPATAPEQNDAAANKSVAIATTTAKELGIALTVFPVHSKDDNATVAKEITRAKYDGIIVGGDSLVWGSLSVYIAQAIAQKIPLSVFSQSQVQDGALFGLGPNFNVSGRQSADIANKILRGGNAGEIAVQIPQLIFVINQDTANKIGAHFSPSFLKKADLIVGTSSAH